MRHVLTIGLILTGLCPLTQAKGPQLGVTFPNMKLGLWEVHSEIVGNDAQAEVMRQQQKQMQEMMKKMSPEARAQMQQAIGKQGMHYDPGSGSVKVCIKPERIQSLKQGEVETPQHCSKPVITTRNNGWSFTMSCNEKGRRTDMTGNVTLSGDSAYTSTFNIASQNETGQTKIMAFKQSAKWISAACIQG
ncbi:DUF3617 family protein [Chitinivorax sp. B]|uniref:DUF3617 domain-containing protein n=1 Tax=Chitinivorax sp. B TaxID=2502235 RepID=UPI0010FA3AA6|nr:DUF3617 family protein [Chitinivorax sp. B]